MHAPCLGENGALPSSFGQLHAHASVPLAAGGRGKWGSEAHLGPSACFRALCSRARQRKGKGRPEAFLRAYPPPRLQQPLLPTPALQGHVCPACAGMHAVWVCDACPTSGVLEPPCYRNHPASVVRVMPHG